MRPSFRIFLMFVTTFSLIYGIAHLYVWWRLIHPLKLSGWTAWLARIGLVLLFASFPVIHFGFRHHNGPVISAANFASSLWMGVLVYLVLTTAGYDLLRLITWGRVPGGPAQTCIVAGIVGLVSLYGLVEARCLKVTRLKVAIPDLPAHLEGWRIAQISDVHMGHIVRGRRLDQIVSRVNQLEPDLIAITGDLVDAETLNMREMIAPLERLNARHGVFAVTGNHEFFAGVRQAQAFVEQAGVTMLRNRWVTVDDALQLVGYDDPVGSRVTGQPRPALGEVIRDIDRSKPIILLYHTPTTTLTELESLGIDLQLSGHTHKGQLWPFNFIVKKVYPATPYGRFTNGRTTIYVSTGAGTWGPPMRVAARPEIVLITLTGQS